MTPIENQPPIQKRKPEATLPERSGPEHSAVEAHAATVRPQRILAPAPAAPASEPHQRGAIYQELREIRSWVDVAPVLKELCSSEAGSIRISFPPGSDTSQSQQEEQEAIREFLCKLDGRTMDQVIDELKVELDRSATFEAFAANHGIEGAGWIQALFPDGAPARLLLETTQMVSLASPGNGTTPTTDVLASPSIGNHDTGAKVIFEAPMDIDREALAARLQKYLTENPTLEALVWLVDRNALNAQHDQSGGTPANTPEGITFEVYRCGEFITRFERRSDSQDEILERARGLPKDKLEILFGPESLGLGLEAYIKHLAHQHRASAVKQVLGAFEGPSDEELAGRREMYNKFERVGRAVSLAAPGVDVVGAVYGAVL